MSSGEGVFGVSRPRDVGLTILSGAPATTSSLSISMPEARPEGPQSRGGPPSGPLIQRRCRSCSRSRGAVKSPCKSGFNFREQVFRGHPL